MTKYPRFAKWLENQYIEWQRRKGERRTAMEFAEWLEIGNATVSQWLNGQARPRPEFAFRLAKRLGLEVYEQLDLPGPDPLLFDIQKNWDQFTEQEKAIFDRIVKEQIRRDETQAGKNALRQAKRV
jgi:transcriptional regulator with XRE-family HTH domain